MAPIRLTVRPSAGPAVTRRLLLLLALTITIIVGMLAMHSPNAHAASGAGHHSDIVAGAVCADQPGTLGASSQRADCAAERTVNDTGHDGAVALACVLALLVAVLLVLRPGAGMRLLAIAPRARHPEIPVGALPRTAPPSLTTLCISRR